MLASGEAIFVVPNHQAMLSGVALKRAKGKAYLSSETTSPAFYKAEALSSSAQIAFSSEANAPAYLTKLLRKPSLRLKHLLPVLK